MGKIITKTVEQTIYVSSDGRETVLTDMADPHLVNAFGQACQREKSAPLSWASTPNETKQLVNALRTEILRRMQLCKSPPEK